MKKRVLGRTGLEVSTIGLGTTEIGYKYGIGPRDLPGESEAIQFLRAAVDLGINFVDTGHFYGSAEERIGKSGIATMPGVVVSTKCGHVLDREEAITGLDLETQIRNEVEESLRRLKVDCISLVQIHGGTKEWLQQGILQEIVDKLKAEGKVQFAGISTRGEEAPLEAIEHNVFDTLQLGISILDQRMLPRVVPRAAAKGIGIINRSVFLKGVLTNAVHHLSEKNMPLKDGSQRAAVIASELGMELPELALRFSLSRPQISTVLVGTNKIEHLKSAIRAAESAVPLDSLTMEKLNQLAINDPKQVDPRYWPAESVTDEKDGKKIHGQHGKLH